METTVIRSSRRSMAIEIKGNRMFIRVPLQATEEQIAAFVSAHRTWIEKHSAEAQRRADAAAEAGKLSMEELRALAGRALTVIPERVKFYAPKVGVTYGRITIRNQRSRWGSCSSKGNLNFNCLLMLAPTEVLDSVVVHELCHRKEMNHSPRFYAEVLRVYPTYRKWEKWLKENGTALMARAEELH